MGPGKPATKAEKARMRDIPDLGCMACAVAGKYRWATVHHLVEAGKRLGHAYTIGLCPWHHQGPEAEPGSIELYGPSLAKNKRDFVTTYGTERQLLELQNKIFEAFRAGLVMSDRILMEYRLEALGQPAEIGARV